MGASCFPLRSPPSFWRSIPSPLSVSFRFCVNDRSLHLGTSHRPVPTDPRQPERSFEQSKEHASPHSFPSSSRLQRIRNDALFFPGDRSDLPKRSGLDAAAYCHFTSESCARSSAAEGAGQSDRGRWGPERRGSNSSSRRMDPLLPHRHGSFCRNPLVSCFFSTDSGRGSVGESGRSEPVEFRIFAYVLFFFR